MANRNEYSEMASDWKWWTVLIMPGKAVEAIKTGAEIIDELLEENRRLREQTRRPASPVPHS